MKSFEQLIRPEVVAMEEYPPVEPTEVISKRLGIPVAQIAKLDANENPYGILEEVKEALAKHPYFHIYPDPLQRDIRAALAQQLQVPEQNIIAGSGIDELLDYLCRMFQNPGDAVVNLPPTFGMYPFDSQLVSGEVISVARQADYNLSVPAIRDAIQQWESSRKTASQSPKAKLLFRHT